VVETSNYYLEKEGIRSMKIGIVVHSHTGNTLAVAESLKEALLKAGHSAVIERISAVNENSSAGGKIELKNKPSLSGYDYLIFGAPVRAFSLSPVMKAYLSQVSSLNGKKASCFVTQQFPFPWMGGNQALRKFRAACAAQGANLVKTGVVNWSRKNRQEQISEVVKDLASL